jgi:hypothetical protein
MTKIALSLACLAVALRCGAAEPACTIHKVEGYQISGCAKDLKFEKKKKLLLSLPYSDTLVVNGARAFPRKGGPVAIVDLTDAGQRRLEFFALGARVSRLGQVPVAPDDSEKALAGVAMKKETSGAVLFNFKSKVGKLGPDGAFLETPGAMVRLFPRAKPLASVLGSKPAEPRPLDFEIVSADKP